MTCPLTRRELEMVQGVADGLAYKQIARALGVSTSTVRSHMHHVHGKLGVVDRAQAVLACYREGWIGRNAGRERVAYYRGAYDECRRLLTSPRMNGPQREVIEGEAFRLRRELERRGVTFHPGGEGATSVQ